MELSKIVKLPLDIESLVIAASKNILPWMMVTAAVVYFLWRNDETHRVTLETLGENQQSITEAQVSIRGLIAIQSQMIADNAQAVEEGRQNHAEYEEVIASHLVDPSHDGVEEIAWRAAVDAVTMSNYEVEARRLASIRLSVIEAVQEGNTGLRDDLDRIERDLEFYTREIAEIMERNTTK